MCGIAGVIYRDNGGAHAVGHDMTAMLQSMKHRGPDSTGYALYGQVQDTIVMRYTLADANDARDFDFEQRLEHHKREVESRLRAFGARNLEVEKETGYAYRVTFNYDGELKAITDVVEDVPNVEVLSLGHSLEIIKDLGDAEQVAEQYRLGGFVGTHAIGHVGMATDEMAAKPLVLYEGDDIVALASEEIAIRAVVHHEIETWDPYEGEVMVWTR